MQFRIVLLITCTLSSSSGLYTTNIYHNVSLSWNDKDRTLNLRCRVVKMGLGVIFIDPRGRSRGHCNSPILAKNVTGTCDRGITQTILPDQSVDNVLTIHLVKCENGVWKCIHGQNRNEEDTTQVVMDINIRCPRILNTYWERCRCAVPPLAIGYIVGYFIFKPILHMFCNTKEDSNDSCWNKTRNNRLLCWQYFLMKMTSVVFCVLIVPFLALIQILCEEGMTYTLLIGIWSFSIAIAEIVLSEKALTFIESKCPTYCVCKSRTSTNGSTEQDREERERIRQIDEP